MTSKTKQWPLYFGRFLISKKMSLKKLEFKIVLSEVIKFFIGTGWQPAKVAILEKFWRVF
jgi:hypothetical protein